MSASFPLTAAEREAVMHFADGDPDENPWVAGKPRQEEIDVVDYDPRWPQRFAQEKARLERALGPYALHIEHVGSTAVPALAAKPIIDIDLLVADPANEAGYIPPLTALGYVHTIREPSWYQHRMLRLDAPQINLHVFAIGSPEHLRHRLFRDWLIAHPEDRQRYVASKRRARQGVNTMTDYNRNKQETVRQIYAKIFAALRNSAD
ncbi:GrpB family protein [Serratia rubidaea]|uniref:Dephospho-CoA kinase/protein folding accessory domain-containing protein n=1 Tax=Serratia rubidaea TaxID=61652 RepID=A0A3S4FWA8_SERRU|nr:GrpB family protein [Serratia rubidaea]MBD8453013.1 GrpB family protein [Serratia rubidaea]MBS0975380.1 GrpB family protein [Serratia rubidaea]VEA73796.1 dephospho-CoA kinase/protein folding accessory domain-containing protein [Serratia rubidaea]